MPPIKRAFLACTVTIALNAPWATVMAAAASPVQRYFQSLQSLRAEFTQQVLDEHARVLQHASGHMLMQKPGRFRWDYRTPTAQVIVSDSERLWTYDVELAQVSVRTLDKALGAMPLALLTGTAPLEDTFVVSGMRSRDGMEWYDLTPRATESDVRVLRVGFRAENLAVLELEDRFGQRTHLEFQKVERNPTLDPGLLQFTPPPGVDVVGQTD